MDEFVESIPFTETREYVQAILRNESLYRALAAHSDTTTASSVAPRTPRPAGPGGTPDAALSRP
jgi:soluble lytic murein transglycosylase